MTTAPPRGKSKSLVSDLHPPAPRQGSAAALRALLGDEGSGERADRASAG